MQIEELMSRPVLVCGPNDTLQIPAQLMWDQGVGCVVVQKEGKVIGVITDRDICMGAYTSGQALWELPVSRSMTAAPATIDATATVDDAEQLMRQHHVRRLPVIDANGVLVGVISLDDLAREARRQFGRGIDGIAATLGAVADARTPKRPSNGTLKPR